MGGLPRSPACQRLIWLELGIIPAPADAEPYLELARSASGRLFSKHILTIGRRFIHPKTGKPLTLGEDAWAQMKTNFDSKRITQIAAFPLADDKNRHVENPQANAGECVGLERDGDRVIAVIDVRDPDVAQRIADGRLLGASAMLHLDARDPQTGERAGVALLHVAGTNRPALVDLAPYEPLVAACGPAWTTLPDGSACGPQVLMLCQSEVDPDPPVMLSPDSGPGYRQPDPGYGRHHMQYDEQRDEIDRYGLEARRLSEHNGGQGSVTAMAARVSAAYAGAGRGTKPEYDHAALEAGRQPARLSAVESLRAALPGDAGNLTPLEVCTAFSLQLSARPELVALTGGQASQASVMTSARREAFERSDEVSTDTGGLHEDYVRPGESKDPEAIAEALIGMSNELGGTDDPAALALSAASESDRLTAENPDMLELAWQPASGAGTGRDSAEAAIARHPELSFMFRPGKTSSRRHPRRSDELVDTGSRAHSSDTGEESTRDTDQPAKGGQPHRRGAAAIIADNPELFGTRENATGNQVHPARSAAQRQREETRSLAGGRPQNRIER